MRVAPLFRNQRNKWLPIDDGLFAPPAQVRVGLRSSEGKSCIRVPIPIPTSIDKLPFSGRGHANANPWRSGSTATLKTHQRNFQQTVADLGATAGSPSSVSEASTEMRTATEKGDFH
jgi:hypothetical protein